MALNYDKNLCHLVGIKRLLQKSLKQLRQPNNKFKTYFTINEFERHEPTTTTDQPVSDAI